MLYFIVFANQNSRPSASSPLLPRSASSVLKLPHSSPQNAQPSPIPPGRILPLDPLQPPPFAHFDRKTQNPLLCFQSFAHSFAIRAEGEYASPLVTTHSPLLLQEQHNLPSVTPFLATLTKSSILRIPQPLCLPLLRKLPGCQKTIPKVELPLRRHLVLVFRTLSTFNFRPSTRSFRLLQSFHGIIRGLCFP